MCSFSFVSAIGEGSDVDNKDIQGLLNDTGKCLIPEQFYSQIKLDWPNQSLVFVSPAYCVLFELLWLKCWK